MTAAATRFLEPRDIPAILQIQTSSREAAQWPQSAYENLDREGEQAWVTEQDGCVAGFLVARAMAGEMEILNLAVDVRSRRRGFGRVLLREALSWAVQNGASWVFLEVRASNAAARQFYQAHGFASSGIRKDYYRNPVEDALLLSRSLVHA